MKISLFSKKIILFEIEKEIQKEDTREVKLFSLKNILIVIGIFVFLASAVYMIINFSLIKISDSPNNIGDTIGGITAPILNTFSIIILYYAFNAQIKANKLLKEDLDIQKRNFHNDQINSLFQENININKTYYQEFLKTNNDKNNNDLFLKEIYDDKLDSQFIKFAHYINHSRLFIKKVIIEFNKRKNPEIETLDFFIYYLINIETNIYFNELCDFCNTEDRNVQYSNYNDVFYLRNNVDELNKLKYELRDLYYTNRDELFESTK